MACGSCKYKEQDGGAFPCSGCNHGRWWEPMENKTSRCEFCGALEQDTQLLISGLPPVKPHICEQCVLVCVGIMEEKGITMRRPRKQENKMSKHTSGPWVIYPETDGTEICAVDSVPGLPVRQIICRPVRGANWIANASLIAAAPELLAALDGLFDEFGDFNFDIAAINAARTAREKAKA